MAGDAEATGLTTAQAASAFYDMLSGNGDSGDETPGDDTPNTEVTDEEMEVSDEDASEEDADQEDEPDQPEQPQTFKVVVDGQEQEVTLEELTKGYSREADYTRKTMAVAEERKKLTDELAAFAPYRERTTNLLRELEQNLNAPIYDQAEMAWLRTNDPGEYAARLAEEQQRVQQRQNVTAERQRQEQIAQYQQAQAQQAFREEQDRKLLEAQPAWKDPVKGKMAMEQVRSYMLNAGATPDEIGMTFDHRIILAMWKAAEYDKLNSKAPQPNPKPQAIRPARPGAATGQQSRAVTEVTRAKQRLAKTGSVEDAQKVFLKQFG